MSRHFGNRYEKHIWNINIMDSSNKSTGIGLRINTNGPFNIKSDNIKGYSSFIVQFKVTE